MRVAALRETIPGERRVAITPESARQLIAAGFEVVVQAGAGIEAGYPDAAYADAGATIETDPDPGALDVLAHVRPVDPGLARRLRRGALSVGLAAPGATESVRALRDAGVTAFALELIPRISRAQSMDALTSQALIAGYRCVLEAAMRLPRFFPLYMTAAGTIPPAKVLVLGVGVAGLQAIATAKRLGARVSANDIRTASADEVASMGGTFIHLDLDAADGGGGYARELAADRAARQRELLTPHIHDADVLITTAAIPGRAAPVLVTDAMLDGMRPGSVIVDLAAESGGNVEGSVAGEEVRREVAGGAITIVGMKDAASTMPYDASRLYAKNVANLLDLLVTDGELAIDESDEVIASALLTRDGEVRHAPTAEALGVGKES